MDSYYVLKVELLLFTKNILFKSVLIWIKYFGINCLECRLI